MNYYIASCVFTAKNPELSNKIQEYMASFNDIQTVRCCVPGIGTDTLRRTGKGLIPCAHGGGTEPNHEGLV